MATTQIDGRRHRYDPVDPEDFAKRPLNPNDGDTAVMEAILHHGPLNSLYLPHFRNFDAPSYGGTVHRLTQLASRVNTLDNARYLFRPDDQRATDFSYSNFIVYDLFVGAKRLLQREDLWSDRAPLDRSNWTHAFMLSCITASIAIECRRAGLGFIPQAELLDGAAADLRLKVPYLWEKKGHHTELEQVEGELKPDGLFGIEWPSGRRRLYIVEADRGTEPGDTPDRTRKSYKKNIRQYRSYVAEKMYKDHLKTTDGLIVLNVFNSEARKRLYMDVLAAESGANSYQLTQSVEGFKKFFTSPPILSHLFTEPWERVGKESFLISTEPT